MVPKFGGGGVGEVAEDERARRLIFTVGFQTELFSLRFASFGY